MKTDITLFGTSACHLCENALAIVMPTAQAFGIRLQQVDIAGNDALEEKYGIRIPVIAYNGKELSWPFDAAQLTAFLAAQKT